jgi:branched-chain amino acid transport system ATP-binding protein
MSAVSASSQAGLKLSDFGVKRGQTSVVQGVSLEVQPGLVTVLLGVNGAGKTTLLEAISGVIPAAKGGLELGEQNLFGLPRIRRWRAGLAHVEQGRMVFASLSVEENLRVGRRGGADLERAFALFPELQKRRHTEAKSLSGGEQQMGVIARALLGEPKVLLIDEMSLGLAPLIVSRLMGVVRSLADGGMAVLLVEQFAQLALSIGDHAAVMAQGSLRYSGSAKTLLEQPELLHAAYLG